MVSLGDTAISLHILQPPLGGGGGFWVRSDLDSAKKVGVFNFRGEGAFWARPDLDSAKKIRVFNLGGGVLGKVRFGLCKEN